MAGTPTIAVVADTTSYLPAEMLAEHDVHLVSLYVGLDGEQEAESDLLTDLDGFYRRLRASEEAVTTSQPSVGDFIGVYEPLLDQGPEIVSVHISAGISGTYEAAMQACQRLSAEGKGGERIHVVDSATGAGGMALVLLAAARAASAGAAAEECVARAHEARDGVKIWFAVDTLEYLRRGGRIGGADGWVVQHVQDPESAAKLIEECKPIFGSDPVFSSELGPVLGSHVGPGLLGVGSVRRDLVAD